MEREEKEHLSKVLKQGFLNGRVVWNKGLTKETDERVKKYGLTRKNTGKGWLEYGYKKSCMNGKKMLEHHKVWVLHNQCLVPSDHIVHHIDGNKLNNEPDNLELLSRSEHATLHHVEGDMNPYGCKTGGI